MKKCLFFFLLIFNLLSGEEEFFPQRLSFPHLCDKHFDQIGMLQDTWLEPSEKDFIQSLDNYLFLIPKAYYPHCVSCCKCEQIKLTNDSDMILPVKGGVDKINKLHFDVLNAVWGEPFKEEEHFCRVNESCENLTWDGSFFRKWNDQYRIFFKHFLTYCYENQACDCFWREHYEQVSEASDEAYKLIKKLSQKGFLDVTFSRYWKGNFVQVNHFDLTTSSDGVLKSNVIFRSEPYFPTPHGIASSLTTYMFFYSQYHSLFHDIVGFMDKREKEGTNERIDEIFECLEKLYNHFWDLYDDCLAAHPHPKIYYERGMLKLHYHNYREAIEDIRSFMDLSKDSDSVKILPEMYLQEGKIYSEMGLYDKAIITLSNLIKENPEVKEAYFERALAYFESGNFEEAIEDFVTWKIEESPNEEFSLKAPEDFTNALFSSMIEGANISFNEFIPSTAQSIHGLGMALWTCVEQPKETLFSFMNASLDLAYFLSDHLKKIREEGDLDDYTEAAIEYYSQFESLPDADKGKRIGYAIGRYGVDFFLPLTTLKGISAYNKLRRANRLCNLEALSLSQTNKKKIVSAANEYAIAREKYFKSLKIHWDRQNKHIPGAHNYIENKGTITIPREKLEKLVMKKLGTGQPANAMGNLGPGFRERIDFEEVIGNFARRDAINNTIKFEPTTKGIIHYSKDGVHVVPASPYGTVEKLL